jgi:hypothetical protein
MDRAGQRHRWALSRSPTETLLERRSTLPHSDATAEDLTYVDDAVEAIGPPSNARRSGQVTT